MARLKIPRQDGKNKAQTHVSAFSATLAPACHLINTMFTRVATDWYAYYGTLYKMASEQPGVKDLFNSDRQVCQPYLSPDNSQPAKGLRPHLSHGQGRGRVLY